jgi:hypothetical protein
MICGAFDRDQLALQRAAGIVDLLQSALDSAGFANDFGRTGDSLHKRRPNRADTPA